MTHRLHGQIVALESLQYPRYLHRAGELQLVAGIEAARQALSEGWTLSPESLPPAPPVSEPPTETVTTAPATVQPDATPTPAPKKRGRPKTAKE